MLGVVLGVVCVVLEGDTGFLGVGSIVTPPSPSCLGFFLLNFSLIKDALALIAAFLPVNDSTSSPQSIS